MKKIKLSQGKVALVDDEDFEFLSQWKWHYAKGYAIRNVRLTPGDGGRISEIMHRVIMNCPEGKQVDHINGDKLNNQKTHLRICTNKQNTRNSKPSSNNKSGYKGVCWKPLNKKWCAQITVNGKKIYLGMYSDKVDAAKMYDKVAKKYYKEFAYLNFPENK